MLRRLLLRRRLPAAIVLSGRLPTTLIGRWVIRLVNTQA